MTNRIQNIFQSVKTVLTTNEKKYEATPVFKSRVDEFTGNISLIQEADKDRSETRVPVATEKKDMAEERLIQLTLKAARIINVYAFNTKNIDIQALTNISKSTFYHLSDNRKLTLMKSILTTANKLPGELANYGFGKLDLDELTDGVAQYEVLIVSPRDTINERKGKTRTLAQLFADTKSLLYDQLDKLMSLFKESDLDFYNAYFDSRNVINTAYRKRKN